MPPKRREKEIDGGKNNKSEGYADHEQFLQAFEKPTQIYRYLKERHMLKPIFLTRTLSYMKHRMRRSNKRRKHFKVDSLLEKKLNTNSKLSPTAPFCGFLTLTFLGFYNKQKQEPQEAVNVETILLKLCHKKRKDVACPVMRSSLGTKKVPFNPSEESPPLRAPTVSIPTSSFSLNGQVVKSYHLLLTVNVNANNAYQNSSDNDSEPSNKRRKYSKSSDDDKIISYSTDVIIYDKQKRCMLSDGDYEFYLEETSLEENTRYGSSLATWEEGFDQELKDQHITSFEKVSEGPTLKFQLNWTREPVTAMVNRPVPIIPVIKKDPLPLTMKDIAVKSEPGIKTDEAVLYQFLYNSNSKQQTEATNDMRCIWCSLDCGYLYSLVKHLKLCHPRFHFTYTQTVQGSTRIDVTINEGYDGSLWGPVLNTLRRSGPQRVTPLSHVIVCHPKRPNKMRMSEFLDMDVKDFDTQRPYITGHNRLYHHTTTCLPIYPKEMEVDSEDETDPRWLQKKTIMMIDDFTDVNEGEKELMKMWNLHVMRHGSMFVGDCQVPLACTLFLQQKGKEMLRKNLYRNFVCHMGSLFDFGLVSPVTLFTIMQKVQEIIQSDRELNRFLQESWQNQREHWNSADQKPKGGESNKTSSGVNLTDSGQRRKPTSEKKPTPKKSVNEKKRHPEARRRLSLPSKPELRRKVLKEASALPLNRRSSFTGDNPNKRKLDSGPS